MNQRCLTGLAALLISLPCLAADRVFLNGVVYTVDDQRSRAQAVAVEDGRISYVGDEAGVRALIGKTTVVHDLEGGMLLPGFHDSHIHILAGVATEAECDLLRIDEHEAVTARLRECRKLEGFGEDRWVIGSGWSEWLWPDSRPHKAELDALFPDRPVFLGSSYGHSAWVNSRALELAGITSETQDPPQGVIERDTASGEPMGTLRDAAVDLVRDVLPEWSDEQAEASVRAGIELAHANGITAVIEPGMNGEMIAPVVRLADRGELKLRALASLSPLAWHPGAFGDEIFDFLDQRWQWRRPNLNVDSVKIYMDGVIESGTGALLEEYSSGGFGLGPRFYTEQRVSELFTRFDQMGLRIHVHAIGDAGVRMALDGFEAMRQANGVSGNRHHIVHLQLIDEADHPRFGELDVTATFQALWAYPDPSVMELDRPLLGEERTNSMYPIGSVHRAGGRIAGGSDYFVTDLNPLRAIEVALTRRDPDLDSGPRLGPGQAVDLATMIEAYTRNGAWLMNQEGEQGSIEVGKRADLVVLEQDLFAVEPNEIAQVPIVMTVFDGEVVFQRQP